MVWFNFCFNDGLWLCWMWLWLLLFVLPCFLSPTQLSSNMSGNHPIQALFHSFDHVSNFVQHHLSDLVGLQVQSSGPSGRGSLFSIASSIKAPHAKTTSFVHPSDNILKVSIINYYCNLKFLNFYHGYRVVSASVVSLLVLCASELKSIVAYVPLEFDFLLLIKCILSFMLCLAVIKLTFFFSYYFHMVIMG